MNCPKCEAEMEPVTYRDIEVDRCTGCKGIWFGLLEREKLAELPGSEAIDTGDPETGKRFDDVKPILCPVCQTRMIRMVDNDQPHVHYESCQVCNGVFFDAGEFAQSKSVSLLDRLRDLLSGGRD